MSNGTNEKPITIEDLAAMTERGFEDVESRLGQHIDKGFAAVLAHLEPMSKDLREVKTVIPPLARVMAATEAEVQDLRTRGARLEAKLGLAA